MLDGVSKQLASLFEIVAGIKQAFDLPAVPRPLPDLVKNCDRARSELSVPSSDQ
jgi:hypothetical protein